ncbi:retrovirus-related pol polyprotein from transposon TNT 1-94 [Tanacetum coccineum]
MTGGDASAQKKNEGEPDVNSPLYIHASDYPKQMHVNETLTDNNYSDWSQEMMNFLFAKNKVGFVDGSINKPGKDSSDYMPWMRCDAMVKGWLTTAMEKEIRISVKYANTASEIWADLKEQFGKESAPRAYELKQNILVTHQNGATISVYYPKLRSLWDEIESVLPMPTCSCNKCTCDVGKKLSGLREKERLYEFLMGLDDHFSRAISADKKPVTEVAAFKASGPMRREGSQFQRRDKSIQKDAKRVEVVKHCTNYEKDGHSRDGCFELIGYPEWWSGNKKREETKPKAAFFEPGRSSPIPGLTNEQYESFLKHFSEMGSSGKKANASKAYMTGKANNDDDWVIDSGSTEHITHDASILENKTKSCFETPIIIPNGDAIPVEGKGEFRLPRGSKIKGVLHIPKFTCNLLSVSRLSKDLQSAITFFPDFCIMQKLHTRSLIGAGECRNGLYRMGIIRREKKAMMTSMDIWHKRLGHASGDKLTHIDFLNDSSFDQVCDSCIKAKHTKLPFPKSSIKTNDCFELIHCDIWGKYRVPSISGANYFLTIVDDFSRSVWVFLLKFKHEASSCLMKFHTMIKTQFGKSVKRICTDNGGEFTSNDMLEFYNDHGILLETSCPHTPQQNRVVERKHRHLLETARALIFEANLPKRFWGECVLTATFIINRLPSKVIKNKNPYEIVFDQKPDYDDMKIFGCLSYYKNSVTNGDKFEVRGKPGSNPSSNDHQNSNESVVQEDNSESPNGSTPNSTFDEMENSVAEETLDDPLNQLGRPKRHRSHPKHFEDFVVKLPPSVDNTQTTPTQASSTVHSLSNFVSYERFSNSHKAFLAAIDAIDEPKSFHQAIKDERWTKAMRKEIRALEENGTWILQALPDGKRAIDSKWVYKIKYKPNGEVERYKMLVATKNNWFIHQLDVNNAFLHGDLTEEVYMKIPQGFAKEGETKVCRLRKSIYGLKQASRNWYQKFTNALLALDFKQSKADHSLFIYHQKDIFVAALIYVDDVLLVGNNITKMQHTKAELDHKFSIKDLGSLKYFLGIEVARTHEGLVLSQRKYTLDILADCGFEGCRQSSFPIEQNHKLDKSEDQPKVDRSRYRRIVGRLLYMQATRPDIAYAISILSQFVSDPRQPHMDVVHHVLRYLKSTHGQGVLFPRTGGFNLTAYCDYDWLGCPYTRRSRTGYVLLLGGAPISWKTKKHSVVSCSSVEAEYRSMAFTVSEIIWVRWLLNGLNVASAGPTPLFCDNQVARHIANNPIFHERTKHVEMDCYFVRERVDSKEIQPFPINSKMQIADLLSKGLGTQQLREQRLLLNEEALRETLEEEARAEKEWEKIIRQEQAHDELFRLEFEVQSDSESN